MTTIADLAQTLQEVLTTTADALARKTGFVQRASTLTGAAFAQALVFGWLATPHAPVEALAQAAAAVGVPISPQGLDQRMGESAAVFMEELRGGARGRGCGAGGGPRAGALHGGGAVRQHDGRAARRAGPVVARLRGRDRDRDQGRRREALTLHVRGDLRAGTLTGPLLTDGRTNDAAAPAPGTPLPAGALRVADVGFFDLDPFRDRAARAVYWLSRLQFTTAVYDADGHRREALALRARAGGQADEADRAVTRGVEHRLPACPPASLPSACPRRSPTRAVGARAPTPSGTGAPRAPPAWPGAPGPCWSPTPPGGALPARGARPGARPVAGRVALQALEEPRPQRRVAQRAALARPVRGLRHAARPGRPAVAPPRLVGCWAYPDRSLVKAAQTVRQHALALATALPCAARLADARAVIQRCLAAGCRITRRTQRPNTYQLLLDPALLGLG